MSAAGPRQQGKPFYREMTVAHVRERPGTEATAVAFLESARFYTLRKDNRRYAKILKHLKDAMAGRRSVKVRLASPDSDVIEDTLP